MYKSKDSPEISLNCQVCNEYRDVMKRCTRCRKVFYCSRECQIKDWSQHIYDCGNSERKNKESSTCTKISSRFSSNDGSIFGEEEATKGMREENTDAISKGNVSKPVINFQPAVDKLKKSKSESAFDDAADKYLFHGKHYSDIPVLDSTKPYSDIIVRANKEKYTISIQNTWSGTEIFKVMCFKLRIPLDKIKVIHKGKVMTQDTIQSHIAKRAVFQVIGEEAANEDGLDKKDIDLMMQQLNIDRNAAVLALRKSGDVIDAMLQLGNK